jgi:hypothetical protein
VPDAPLLPPQLIDILRAERRRTVPFIGAGLSVEAGVPAAEPMAQLVAEKANERGATVDVRSAFAEVCADVNEQLSHEQLQEIVSELVLARDVRPTALLQLLARVLSRKLLTSNYDDATERSIDAVGLTPKRIGPKEAAALGEPAEGEVFVIHVHGLAEHPASIVLPGPSLDALGEDEAFLNWLRGVLAPHTVLYLGYRFPPEDAYLPGELRWLGRSLIGTGTHALLLPAHEYTGETRARLHELQERNFRVFTFDAARNYEAVQQAGLVVAPAQQAVAETVEARVAQEMKPYFRPPLILPEDPSVDREQWPARIMAARMGMAEDPFVLMEQLRESGTTLVIGEPGMGKTQLLYRLGEQNSDWPHVYLRLRDLASALGDEAEAPRAFASALRGAKAFDDATPKPTLEGLEQNTYAFLLDGLDEIAADRRAEVTEALASLTVEYPQHLYVVTSRPIGEREQLVGYGFTAFRLVLDGSWGRDFLLETRGIPQSRVDALYEQLPRVGELLGIPLYAALIGERLADDRELPASALELITDVGVRDAARAEAESGVFRADSLYRFLQTLALTLELRGVNEARVDDLAGLAAPTDLDPVEVRERLVERALLRDLPDVAAFQTVTIQEGLAAEGLHRTDDPVRTLREVAVAEVGGQDVLRGDLDHALDLFFEAAPPELRPALRALDELRWARTQRVDITSDEALETLEFLWGHFVTRRNWIDSDRSRELRDARAAIERLTSAHTAAAAEMRPTLIGATADDERTTRGNAIFFLQQLGRDDETAEWLLPRLRDQDDVVRRWAAHAAETMELIELRDDVAAAYQAETDELAAEALAFALFALTPETDRLNALRDLMANRVGWGRVAYLAEKVPLSDALSLLEEGGIASHDAEQLLERLLEERPLEQWQAADAERVAAIIVAATRNHYYHPRYRERIDELVERFPDEMVAGARRAATDETGHIDVWFLRDVSRSTLEQELAGPLAEPARILLQIRDSAAATPTAPVELDPTREQRNLAEWIDEGRINETRCPSSEPVIHELMGQVPSLDGERRARLASYARAWWPTQPLTEVVRTDGGHGECPQCFPAALAAAAALDFDIDRDRWLDMLRSHAVWFHRAAADWMARHFPERVEDAVGEHLAGLDNIYLLDLALRCFPYIDEGVAHVAATTIARLGADDAIFLLPRFREESQLNALGTIAEEAASEALRRAARRELALSGDLDAQHAELAALQASVAEGLGQFRHDAPKWLTAAGPEVVDELGEVLVELARHGIYEETELGRTLVTAIERIGDERGLAIYERLMHDETAPGASFYWYPRERLAREIARRRVLSRLPEDLAGLVELLETLGYDPRTP